MQKGIEKVINKRRATRSHKNRYKVDIGREDSLFGGDRSGPGALREGDLGGGMDYGLEAVYLARQWAKARRI